jgi:hypothetical protein
MSAVAANAKKSRLWWFPSVEVLIFIIVFLLSLFAMPNLINSDGDLGRHITIGEVLLDQRAILREDIFSHTMLGEKLILHEWLSDLLFGLIDRTAGLDGIAWMTAAVIAATYALLTAGLKLLNVRTFVRLLAGFAAFLVGAIHWHTRPHIFTTLIFTYFVLTLVYYYQTGRWQVLLPLPFVMVLWANLHGAFVSGLVLVALFGVGLLLEKKFSMALKIGGLLLALILASWINPFGPQMVTHSFGYLQLDYLVDFTYEYNTPDFHNAITWPFAGLIVLSVVMGWRSTRRLGWVPLVLISFWTASGLYAARNIPLYGQLTVIFLAGEADHLLAALSPRLDAYLTRTDQVGQRAWGWMWAVVFAGLLIFLEANGGVLDYAGLGNNFDPAVFPVEAIDALEESGLPEGKVFNEFGWGGYLLYRLWPEKLVFIDGQTDFYGEALTFTHEQTLEAHGDWRAILDTYDVQWVILPPYRGLGPWLDQSPEWELIYSDETASVWARR